MDVVVVVVVVVDVDVEVTFSMFKVEEGGVEIHVMLTRTRRDAGKEQQPSRKKKSPLDARE